MNNASSSAGASGLPAPTPFAPGASDLPQSLAPGGAEVEPFLLLVNVSNDAAWAGDAAIALAAEWARVGRRIVLADLHLEDPVLHERVGEQNLDGVVDIFLYGASVARSARPPLDHEFFLIPSGTYTAAPEDVYAHPRWTKLIAGFHEAGATLMVFVPPSEFGIRQLARCGRGAVLIGTPAAYADLPLDALEVRAVLTPPDDDGEPAGAPPVVPPPLVDAPEPATDGDADVFAVDGSEVGDPLGEDAEPLTIAVVPLANEPEPQRLAADVGGSGLDDDATVEYVADPEWTFEPDPPAQPPPPLDDAAHAAIGFDSVDSVPEPGAAVVRSERDGRPADGEGSPGSPVIPPGRRRRRSGPGPMLWLLVGVAVLAIAVIVVALVRPELFGGVGVLQRGGQAADTTGVAEAIPPPPPAPSPVGDTLPFAVQVRAYIALQPARTQAEQQARRVPDTPFYIVPETTQGVLYYKVMAGLLADTTAATELRRRLVQLGVVAAQDARDDAPGAWSLIQARPLAFHLGEFPERGEAVALVDSLSRLDIPAYPVAFPYSDGTARFRVYAGAYPDSLQAEELRQMLRAADLPARLVHRIGQGPVAGQ